MGSGLLDQRDRGLAFLAQPIAELGGQFQTAGAAADDHDLMQMGVGADDIEGLGRGKAGPRPGVGTLFSMGNSRIFAVVQQYPIGGQASTSCAPVRGGNFTTRRRIQRSAIAVRSGLNRQKHFPQEETEGGDHRHRENEQASHQAREIARHQAATKAPATTRQTRRALEDG